MVGYAVSGFMDGFFKGRDKKFEWEDRDRNYERQQRLDKMAEERHAAIMARYGREAADWDRANRERTAELGILDDAYDATVAAGGEPVQTTAGAAADAEEGKKRPAPSDDPRVIELGAGIAAQPPMTSFAGMMERTSPASELAARAEKEGSKTPRRASTEAPGETPYQPGSVPASMMRNGDPARVGPMVMPPPPVVAGPPIGSQPGAPTEDAIQGESLRDATFALGADAVGYGQARVDPRLARAVGLGAAPPQPAPQQGQIVPARGMPANPQVVTQGPGPGGAIPADLYEMGAIAPRYQEGLAAPQAQPQQAPPRSRQVYVPGQGVVTVTEPTREEIDAKAAAARSEAASQWGDVGRAIVKPVEDFGRAAHGLPPRGPYGMGAEAVPPRHRPDEMAARAANAPPPRAPAPAEAPQLDPSNPVPPMRAAAPKGASPAEAETVAAVTDAVNSGAVSPPAADAARAAVADLGTNRSGKPMTESQYSRASKSFMDRYLEVGAPMVMEHYVKTGQFKKAEAFQAFLDTQQARENMKDWGVAAAAIASGDVDKALETVLDAYKRMDYFDDTTDIVREESGVVYDKDGNAAGVKLVFKDPKTGTTFEQVYDSMDDAIALGMTLMDPLTAFEHVQQKAEQQRQYELGLAEVARAQAEAAQKRIDEFTKMIYEGSKENGIGAPTMTLEEAAAQARVMVLGPQAGGAAGVTEPPLARRPGS